MSEPTNAVAIIAAPQPPAISAMLADGIENHVARWTPRNEYPAALIAEAKAALAAMQTYLQPAPPALIELWCRSLRKATARIDEREFEDRVGAIKSASGDLPAWVWCKEALVEAMREFEFFPATKKLDELMRERARKAHRQAWSLRQLATANPAPEPEAEPVQAIPAGLVEGVANSMRQAARR